MIHDILGLTPFKLSFVKRYANLSEEIIKAVKQYGDEVRSGEFPSEGYFRKMDPDSLKKFMEKLSENLKR